MKRNTTAREHKNIMQTVICLLALAVFLVAGMATGYAETKTAATEDELRAAIEQAADGDVIEIAGDISINTALAVNNNITISLKGHKLTSNLSEGSMLSVRSNKTLTLEGGNGTITSAADGARAFSVSGKIVLRNTTVSNFKTVEALEQGGAIKAESGELEIEACSFEGNKAMGVPPNWMQRLSYKPGGGAIALMNDSKALIKGSTFTNNEAAEIGGAVMSMHDTCELEIYDSSFKNNVSKTGGAVAVFSAKKCVIDNNLFENNSAWDEDDRTYTWSKGYTTFASGRGGAIYLLPHMESPILRNNKIIGNRANRGGGISFGNDSYSAQTIIESGLFENNYAYAGGAIDYTIHNMRPLNLDNVLITGNEAVRGGGIWLCPQGSIDISSALGGTVIGNRTQGSTNSWNMGGSISANGDDICHEGSDSIDVKQTKETPGGVQISTRGPGGVKVDWYTDEADARKAGLAEDAVAKGYPNIFAGTDKSFGIHGEIPGVDSVDKDRLLKEAEKGAKIIIKNNKATRGGGVAANSPIVMGVDSDEELELDIVRTLEVKKYWENNKAITNSVKVNLIRYDSDKAGLALKGADGGYVNRTVLDREIVLKPSSDSNLSWAAKFKDLPSEYTKENGEKQFCNYSIEEVKDSRYVGVITEYVSEVDGVYVEITNTPNKEDKDVKGVAEDEDGNDISDVDDEEESEVKTKTKAKNAATGDEAMTQIWILALLISAAILTAVVIRRRRVRKTNSD